MPANVHHQFAELLRPALGGPVQVGATLRPEYRDQLLVDDTLRVLPIHTYTLRPLHRGRGGSPHPVAGPPR
jgi:hypothetical protein